MRTMKRGACLLIAALSAVGICAAANAELGQVQTVYVLSMPSGLDQYLANHLTSEGIFQVVTDPEKAGAILTSEIGPRFEQQLEDLYPPPPEEEAVPAEEPDTEAGNSAAAAAPIGFASTPQRPILSGFGRGKGNVFLVGRESRQVIWSIYLPPKDGTSKSLNRAAERITGELRKALGR